MGNDLERMSIADLFTRDSSRTLTSRDENLCFIVLGRCDMQSICCLSQMSNDVPYPRTENGTITNDVTTNIQVIRTCSFHVRPFRRDIDFSCSHYITCTQLSQA